MPHFGLDPESVAARALSSGSSPRIPSLQESLIIGSLGFAAISLASFGLWAWRGQWLSRNFGELGLYASCALVLIGGGGAVLGRLVIGPARSMRFYGLFALAFFLYAGVWIGSYFSLRNKSGEYLASLLGPAILGMTLANAFGAPGAVRKAVIVLIASHAFGYFAGSFLHTTFAGAGGQLLWGAAYGLGLGAGLGFALHVCQGPVRERLKTIFPVDNTASSQPSAS